MSHKNLGNNSEEGLFLLGQRVRPAPQPRHRHCRAPPIHIDFIVSTENATKSTKSSKTNINSRHGKCIITCNNQISVQALRPSYQLKINTIGDVFKDRNDDDNNDDNNGNVNTQVTWGEGSRALGHYLMNIREAETVQQLQGLLRTHKRIQQTSLSCCNNTFSNNSIHNQKHNNTNNKFKQENKDLDFINILNSGGDTDIDATLAASIGNVYERCFLVHHTVLQDVIAQAKRSADT